jgi:glutamine synthetase
MGRSLVTFAVDPTGEILDMQGVTDESADQTVLLKNFMRVLAMLQGRSITYMACWPEQADSQSAHVHLSLKGVDDTPLFWDDSKPGNMSDTFRHFISGL